MAVFEVSTFAALCKVLLAARKIATDPDILNKSKALADLGGNGKALAAAINDSGLSPLAKTIETRAMEIDTFVTHEGRAKDDARALFLQAVPHALADPALMTGDALDPEATTEAMIAAIDESDVARDFRQTAFAEGYFRAVMAGTLKKMFADSGFIESISPDLWRRSLENNGIQISKLEKLETAIQTNIEYTNEINRKFDKIENSLSEKEIAKIKSQTTAELISVISIVQSCELSANELSALIREIGAQGLSPEEALNRLRGTR